MAPAPEATTEFPAPAGGNITPNGRQRPAVTARYLTKNWARAAGLVAATAAMWLIVIAILIAV